MAHHKSAIKRIRQDEKRRIRNKSYRTRIRTAIKRVRRAIANGSLDEAQTAFKKLVPLIDKMAGKRIIHKNTASRIKSRLNRNIKKLALQQEK